MKKKEKYADYSKSLYGLKQASRPCNMQFSAFLGKYDIQSSAHDPRIFFHKTPPRLLTSTWVNDALGCLEDWTIECLNGV
jgi:hypothetical protein